MNTRSRFVFTLRLLVGLFLSPGAGAEPGDSSGYAARVHSRVALDREFESAMLQMDRSLSALLGSRTMDCFDEDAIGGMETCWVSLESAKAAEAPRGPVRP